MGNVDEVHHDPSAKPHEIQLLKEIATAFNLGLTKKQLSNVGKAPTTTTVKRGPSAKTDRTGGSVNSHSTTTVLLERTATHLVVRKTTTKVSNHRVFSGQGDGLATLHHKGEQTIFINRETLQVDRSNVHNNIQTASDEELDEKKKGPNECSSKGGGPNDDRLCQGDKGGARGESVDASNNAKLILVDMVKHSNQEATKMHDKHVSFFQENEGLLQTFDLHDDGHVPTRAEDQEQTRQHLAHPNANLPTTQAQKDFVTKILKENAKDRDHRTFQQLSNVIRHRPELVQHIYERAAAMSGQESELAEYTRIVSALAAGGTVACQHALLALLGDREGKTEYQRHVTLNALGFTKYGATGDVLDALENMAFDLFGKHEQRKEKDEGAVLEDSLAPMAPITLATIVHFRHHIGDVDPAERQRTMSLQTKLESHAKVALENEHAADSKVIWLNALGNTGHNSTLSIVSEYLKQHGASDGEDNLAAAMDDDMIRAAGVMALRLLPSDHAEGLITDHLTDPSVKVREAAANVYAGNHRQAGEGTAALLHDAWLVEKDVGVLALLEMAKIKAGHTVGLTESARFGLDDLHIPFNQKWEKKFGSDPNYLALEAGFTLQFVMPVADARSGLVMHMLGNDIMILGLGLKVTPTCVTKSGKSKSKTRIVPYIVVFNQEMVIPLSRTEQVSIGACEDDDDPFPCVKTSAELATEGNNEDISGDAVTSEDGGEQSGEGGLGVLTPVCGDIELLDIWSQEFTAPPAPLGRFMTPLGPMVLTIQIEVVFTIGIEGKVSSCSGEDFEKLGQNQACASDALVQTSAECFGPAAVDAGATPYDGENFYTATSSWAHLPKGCSIYSAYQQGTGKMYWNTRTTGGLGGTSNAYIPVCVNNENPRDNYQFMGAFGPYFSVGLRVTASVGYPFILNVNVAIQIDFFKLQPVTTLTASKGEDLTNDIPAVISAADFYVHLLAGSVEVSLTFLPDIFDFELSLIKVQFPGPDGKYACVSSTFSSNECPDEYFINAPGGPTVETSLTLSEFPVSLWCTTNPVAKEQMCEWAAGREKEEDMNADQSLDLPRGKCKASYHCKTKDFDGVVFGEDSNALYRMLPAGSGNICPTEDVINNVEDCKKAIQNLGYEISTLNPRTSTTSHWPSGCSWHKVTTSSNYKRVFFNNHASGNGHSSLRAVCNGRAKIVTEADSTAIHWSGVTNVFRNTNNYRSESNHRNKNFATTAGTELVTGVERPIQSYVSFEVLGTKGYESKGPGQPTCSSATIIKSIDECRSAIRSLGITVEKEVINSNRAEIQAGCTMRQRPDTTWQMNWNGLSSGGYPSALLSPICRTGTHANFMQRSSSYSSCQAGTELVTKPECEAALMELGIDFQYGHFMETSVVSGQDLDGNNVYAGKCARSVNTRPKYVEATGTYKNSCPSGYTALRDKSECVEACHSLGRAMDESDNPSQGSWSHLAPGCNFHTSYSDRTWFNTRSSGGANNNFWGVCVDTATAPICKVHRSCGRVVMSTGNNAYMFDFGGTDSRSSISRITLTGSPKRRNSVYEKVSEVIPEFTACNSDTPMPFWVRTDTFGHVAMGTGSKVGDLTLLQWTDPSPIKWVDQAGFGQVDSSTQHRVSITKYEMNRGYKSEVYCSPPNDEEDPEADGFNDLGDCYRKMPDSYLNYGAGVGTLRNPQNAPQLQCNQGTTLDANHDACISGICRDYGVGVLRCTGCNSDTDCRERTYVGSDCNRKGLRVVAYKNNKWHGADVREFDTNANGGAPGNGKINLDYGKSGVGHSAQQRSEVFACPNIAKSYYSSSKPNGCETSCAISGTLCPMEQPVGGDLSPDGCWDGSNSAGNRGVCMFEERDGDRWGPRKFFCAAPGSDGSWCNSNSHCGAGSVCSLWRCTAPKADNEVCGSSAECISNSCVTVWGATKKCKPTAGFNDYSQCTSSSHCKSNSCTTSFGTDKNCKPSGGWGNNQPCVSDSHCAGNRKCNGRCRNIRLYNKDTICDNCYASCDILWVRCNNCLACGGHHHCNCRTGGCPFVLGRILSNYDSTRCWDYNY